MTWFHHQCTHSLSDTSLKMIWVGGGGGGGCPQEMAKLPEEGYLDISHLLDVRWQIWGARRAQNSQPYDTVGKSKASNKRLIMGKNF